MSAARAVPLADVQRLVRAKGAEGLDELGAGAFLIEIPTQSLSNFYGEGPTTREGTVEYNADLLLDLSRSPAGQVQVWPIEANSSVGRSSRNAVAFKDDDSLSKEHARFIRTGSGWSVEDLGSTNGTYVETTRVGTGKSEALQSPSGVQLGGRRFTFMLADDVAALFSPVASTDPIPATQLHSELATLGSRRFLLRYPDSYLLLSYKSKGGGLGGDFKPDSAFPVIGEKPLTIGRTSQADLTIRSKAVSKWHAKLTPQSGGWAIEDTGSSNGTMVNGRPLDPHTPHQLSTWDSLTIGNGVFGLFLDSRSLIEHLMDS